METNKASLDPPSRRALKYAGLVLFTGAFVASTVWAINSPTPESVAAVLGSGGVILWKFLQV